MSNMLSTGISGLAAAQAALGTVSSNIANTNTDGYSRETVQQAERVAQSNGRYTIGGGVDVVSVQRDYSDFLTSAVWTTNANLQRATTYSGLATTLNSSLSASGNLQGALDTLYAGFSSVANASGNSSTREALLGNASALTTVFNTLGQQLSGQQNQISSQLASTVDSINSVTSNIASLNQQIRQSSTTGPANALLDQRDGLVKKLSGYLGVSAVTESNGTVSVYTSSGQGLVSGNNAYKLSAGSDAYTPGRTDVFDTTGNDISSRLSGGSLGALLDYRSNVLDGVQNQLGQAAVALASSVNAQQARGLDQSGQRGAAIFSVPAPTVLAANSNKGSASVSAAISDVSQLSSSDYTMSYDGAAWNLKTSGGQSIPLTTNANGSLSGAGLTMTVSGSAQAGDSYQLQPIRNAATGLAVSMTDPKGIAAAAALVATAGPANTGTGRVNSISVVDANNPALMNGATVSFPSASAYQVTDGSGNVLASGSYAPGQAISADGWSLSLTGAPAAGDKIQVAANSNGLNDNSNALALAALADKGVLTGGTTSVVKAYANLTTTIGTVGSQAATNLTTQGNLHNQAVSAQQSVSGVNLDEEAANLVKFQQAYQASAQIISTSQTIFSSLLSAIHG